MNCKRDFCISGTYYPQNLSVLIADSDETSSKELKRVLDNDSTIETQISSGLSNIKTEVGELAPDLVYIDPLMDKGKGMNVADELIQMENGPAVVLTVSPGKFNQTHFRVNTLSTLEKPFNPLEIKKSIEGFLLIRNQQVVNSGLKNLAAGISSKRLKFSTRKGHVFLEANEIIYCKADSNYTHLVLTGHRQITVSKSLHHFDNKVLSPNYFRISRSAIINTEYLVEINRNDKNCILKQNGEFISLPITQKHLKHLLDHYCNCYLLNQ